MESKLNSRQWQIYNFLKENCVGEENKMHGSMICKQLGIENASSFKADIKKIRNADVITRKIGSNPQGYWMMLENEDGLEYIKRLTASHLKTAIKQGIPKEYFYQILNGLDNDIILDGQKKIAFTQYEKDTVHRYSDDLKNERNKG